MSKNIIFIVPTIISFAACQSKNKNPPAQKPIIENSVPSEETPKEAPKETPKETPKGPETVAPKSDEKKKSEVPTPQSKNFTVLKCLAKFWTYNFQYYSMIAINPSTQLEITDILLNDQSIQGLSSFVSHANAVSISDGNTDILQEINQYMGNVQPWFPQAFPNGLVFFAKQHPYTNWNQTNFKFVVNGESQIDLSTVCPPLPYLAPAYGDPTYKSVVLY